MEEFWYGIVEDFLLVVGGEWGVLWVFNLIDYVVFIVFFLVIGYVVLLF